MIHADTFFFCMRGKCIVQAFWHAELELSGIAWIRLLYRFRNGESVLNSGFKPGLFRIKSADKNIFKSVGSGYAARKFRITCGIAAFVRIGSDLKFIGKR